MEITNSSSLCHYNGSLTGNYKYEFVEDLPDDLSCTLFHFAFKNAVDLECAHTLCEECFNKMKVHAEKKSVDLRCRACPDRPKIDITKIIKYPYQISMDNDNMNPMELMVKCPNYGVECDWIGELNKVVIHEAACYKEKETFANPLPSEWKQIINRVTSLESTVEENTAQMFVEKDKQIENLNLQIQDQNNEIKNLKQQINDNNEDNLNTRISEHNTKVNYQQKLLEDPSKRREEQRKQFEENNKRFECYQKQSEEHNKNFEDHKKYSEEHNKIFEEQNKQLNKCREDLKKRFEDQNKHRMENLKRFEEQIKQREELSLQISDYMMQP